jgi:tRNA pseudouridine55 synthase
MDGLLIIDKPAGPTSHDVVSRMRRVLREKRIGHTGTLDPAATGVLLLVLGKATRLAKFLSGSDKSYEAVVRFGFSTDTADAEGEPIGSVWQGPLPSRDAIDAALDAFRGTFLQQPPAYSAKKIDGKRSHMLARAGAAALPAPASVTTHHLEILSVKSDSVTLRIDCSAGFYVRSLAHDLGERLGVGAHLTSLRRTRTGDFSIDQAMDLSAAERDAQAAADAVIPLADMLPHLASVTLTADGVLRALHGREIRPSDAVRGLGTGGWGLDEDAGVELVRLFDQGGGLIGIATPAATPGLLHPSVVLV